MPETKRLTAAICVYLALFCTIASAQDPKFYSPQDSKPIPAGSKVFIDPIAGGFDTYLAAGIIKKEVPVVIVTDITKADYEITGISESEKAGWAKMLFMGTSASREDASIKMVDMKSGSVIFAYSVHKLNSARGKQSAGEACAKHIKERIKAN